MLSLSTSIVLYYPDWQVLEKGIQSLSENLQYAKEQQLIIQHTLYIVDNSTQIERKKLTTLLSTYLEGEFSTYNIYYNDSNEGYGRGHNHVILDTIADYHLILNPDVILQVDALFQAILYMQKNQQVGFLTPEGFSEDLDKLYLCKRYPGVMDLFLRGFMPKIVKKYFHQRLAYYEMQGETECQTVENILIASGCFMFFRRSVLHSLRGFSPVYFLYFEDFDLSLRCQKIATISYVPTVKIIHYGGNSAKKGFKHIYWFIRSAWIFFQSHGWKW